MTLLYIDKISKTYITGNEDDGSVELSMKGLDRPFSYKFESEEEFLAVLEQFSIIDNCYDRPVRSNDV